MHLLVKQIKLHQPCALCKRWCVYMEWVYVCPPGGGGGGGGGEYVLHVKLPLSICVAHQCSPLELLFSVITSHRIHKLQDVSAVSMQNELDPHFTFNISANAPRRKLMRTAEDAEQLLAQLKPEAMYRMGLETEEEWQVSLKPLDTRPNLHIHSSRPSQHQAGLHAILLLRCVDKLAVNVVMT